MSERPWMPFYTGDFVKQTMHLGPTERGIYISLLIHAWNHDGEIPLDDYRICNICGCDRRLWWRYKQTVLQFFDIVDASTAQHCRTVTELHRSDEIINKRKGAALHMHDLKRAHALHMQTQSHSHSQYKERGSGEAVRVKDDPVPAGKLFIAAESDEFAAWSKL